MLKFNEEIPSLIKYMGSKSEIIEYIILGLNEIHKDNRDICDLFAGSATLSGALRGNKINIISNDIQQYSEIFAKTYLSNYKWDNMPKATDIIKEANMIVLEWKEVFKDYFNEFNYEREFSLQLFQKIEEKQRSIKDDSDFDSRIRNSKYERIKGYNLFTKDYSGTYWSFEQCVWIDALKSIIDKYKNNDEIYSILNSCVLYAMAYNSQSTGHYAQYRKAVTDKSMSDILIYRRKNIADFFIRKYNELKEKLTQKSYGVITTTLNYDECISKLKKGTLIYADPPYCSVHYSRFYHILETFVKYDYPRIKYDGRYRDDRYQSPFCISTKVKKTFIDMFAKIRDKECELVLSYSNSSTTMISLEELLLECYFTFNNIHSNESTLLDEIKKAIEKYSQEEIIKIDVSKILDKKLNIIGKYSIVLEMFQHKHSRLGRTKVKTIDVLETLILAKKRLD